MKQPFHAGELELQRRAGVLQLGAAVGRGINDHLSAGAAKFLLRQRLAVTATVAGGGRVWASLLTGPAGFIRTEDERLLRIAVWPTPTEPLHATLLNRPEMGLLVMDPATRQRFRVNGQAVLAPEGILLQVRQAYGNCPKYIQRRLPLADADSAMPATPRLSAALDPAQQARIRSADTLFIASHHQVDGPDASHRGGAAGFVGVESATVLRFADYPGNNMFNTLGNLLEHPQAGLLFVDFARGHTLQLAGRATVGDDFAVTFDIEAVRDTPAASPLRWSPPEYWPANPALSQSGAGDI